MRIVLGLAFIAISVLVYFLWSEIKKQQALQQRQRLANSLKRIPVIPPKSNNRPDLRQLSKKDTGYKPPSWHKSQPAPTKPTDPVKPVIPDTFKPINEQPSAQTSQKLHELTKGNRQLAARLISSAKATNPDKSDKWCAEKVVWDLERDRT